MGSREIAIVQSYVNHVARIIDQHFAEKSRQAQLEIIFQLYSKRLLEIRVCEKVLLKEEILPHYQNSWLFLNIS